MCANAMACPMATWTAPNGTGPPSRRSSNGSMTSPSRTRPCSPSWFRNLFAQIRSNGLTVQQAVRDDSLVKT